MRRVIVIGASSGIGRNVAARFAAAGWQVGVGARRTEPLETLSAEYSGQIVWRHIDITRQEALAAFDELVDANGGMDMLLLASGTGYVDPELEQSLTGVTLATNVTGFARIISHAYLYFKHRSADRRGLIATITSIAGTKGIGIAAAYSASKRFQRTYIDALDQLAHLQGVAVDFCDIRPGFVATPLIEGRDFRMTLTVDEAATLTMAAMLKRRRVATIDWRWRAVTALWSLVPRRLWTHMPINIK